ncbi:hypothetical protein BYT27DRAFT_6950638 [Phlegmacium glaucopus]|nr:hypothetical protein BYT27DRAFT_6950638 [Phlegmacium glaucopus]
MSSSCSFIGPLVLVGDRLRQQQRPRQLATWTHRAHRARHLPDSMSPYSLLIHSKV